MNMVDPSVTSACTNYCMYRLPCGYCKEMNSMCPFGGSGYMKITCGSGTNVGTCGSGSANAETIDVTFGSDNNAVHVINKVDNVII